MRIWSSVPSLFVLQLALIPFAEGQDRPQVPIDACQAVALAEDFISVNGYTDAPPDTTRFAYESIEFFGSIEEILRQRAETLQNRAYGYRQDSDGWIVIFRYRADPGDGTVGRAVTMDLTGQHTRVEHQDFYLAAAEVILDVVTWFSRTAETDPLNN